MTNKFNNTTPIKPDDAELFKHIINGSMARCLALMAITCDDVPTNCICYVEKQLDGGINLTPLYVAITEKMVLVDASGDKPERITPERTTANEN